MFPLRNTLFMALLSAMIMLELLPGIMSPVQIIPSPRTRNSDVSTQNNQFPVPERASPADDPSSDHLVLTTANITDCLMNRRTLNFVASSGIISIKDFVLGATKTWMNCNVRVKVPTRQRLSIHISAPTCISQQYSCKLSQADKYGYTYLFDFWYCEFMSEPIKQTVYTSPNADFIFYFYYRAATTRSPIPTISIEFASLPPNHSLLETRMTSSLTGSISTPNWDGVTLSFISMDTWVKLKVPDHYDVMVSFSQIDLKEPKSKCSRRSSLGLYHQPDSQPFKVYCGWRTPGPSAHTLLSDLYIRFVHRVHNIWTSDILKSTGFELNFSFHPRPTVLSQYADGRWNCSVPQWPEFRHHFPCNLKADCIDGEDEALCPYTSASCGKGRFAASGNCYVYITPKIQDPGIDQQKRETFSWMMAEERCRKEGGHLASLNSHREVLDLMEVSQSWGGIYDVFIGMVPAAASLPNLYRAVWKHLDGSISHYMRSIVVKPSCPGPVNSAVLRYNRLCIKSIERGNSKAVHLSRQLLKTADKIIGENRDCLRRETGFVCEVPAIMTAQSPTPSTDDTSQVTAPRLPSERWAQGYLGWDEQSYIKCPDGHVTNDFLACDVRSSCWARGFSISDFCSAPITPLPPAMTCDNGVQHVPYTMVCDHRPDCPDRSDELFCVFTPCEVTTQFECANKNCLPVELTCDGVAHCIDSSDEHECADVNTRNIHFPVLPPAILDLDGHGGSTIQSLIRQLSLNGTVFNGSLVNATLVNSTLIGETEINGTLVSGIVVSGTLVKGTLVIEKRNKGTLVIGTQVSGTLVSARPIEEHHSDRILANVTLVSGTAVCPYTHFQCAHDSYCVPVFTRCNDVYDCPGHEDEEGCDSYQCPGFYRCRGVRVCLHRHEMCDGVIHCPQNDDELLCDIICPRSCTCFGLAFFCHHDTTIDLDARLRYLDASDSGLSTRSVQNSTMLAYLSLARCEITEWGNVSLPNLRFLDLSANKVTRITSQFLRRLPNLRHIVLACNPLTPNFVSNVTSSMSFVSLQSLDLSGVSMSEMDMGVLGIFPSLRTLNLSGCGMDQVSDDGFKPLQELRDLDLRGCPLTYFPRTVFHGLDDLETVFADNYKMCCPETLPSGFYLSNCKAPSNEVSSCEALLRTHFYRICLYIIAVLSCVGNVSSLVFRTKFYRKKSMTGFEIFVTNLCVSDFLMGVYLSIIGVADRYYMGTYLWNDDTWRHSVPCTVAGFLSLVSNEVSAFLICLITLDRFLVLHFPFSQLRFNTTTAFLASLLVWMVCLFIAAAPLLPVSVRWQFYSQTGLCIPLPITRTEFKGHIYSFNVMIVLNFVLFVAVALGQLLVYRSVQKHKMPTVADTPSVFSKDQTLARRLITVAVSDFLCWFPVGLVGIMAANGFQIPGEVNVVLAIFVLPLNSAINPFLYTLNIIMEKLSQSRERRLRQFLVSQMNAQGASSGNFAHLDSNCTLHEAQTLLKLWLSKGVLSREHVSIVLTKSKDNNPSRDKIIC